MDEMDRLNNSTLDTGFDVPHGEMKLPLGNFGEHYLPYQRTPERGKEALCTLIT